MLTEQMVGVEEKREEELLTEQMVRELLMMGVMICLMMEFGVYQETFCRTGQIHLSCNNLQHALEAERGQAEDGCYGMQKYRC